MKINTFLIGVQKAGTSTFWQWLSQHPDVFAPHSMKDFHFFTRPEWRDKGIQYLHSFYKGYKKENIILHGGVNYYFEPEFIDHVLEYQREGKFLIILRDPVERAWSAFQYFTKLQQEKRTFAEALDDELNQKVPSGQNHMFAYLDHGMYGKYLQRILQKVSSDSILILEFEKLFQSPEEHLRLTFEFLEVNPNFEVDTQIIKNASGQPKFVWINEALFSKKGVAGAIKKIFPIQKLMPLTWRIRIGNYIRDANVKTKSVNSKMPEEQKLFLTEYYKKDQAFLKEILNELS